MRLLLPLLRPPAEVTDWLPGSLMDRLTPIPRSRRSISNRVRRLMSYAWLLASLALPAAGVLMLTQGLPALAPDHDVTHQVVAGETLSAIARRYGVTVD